MVTRNSLFGYLSDEDKKQKVWSACSFVAFESPDEWRYDALGHRIRWSEYGNRSSDYGWELDHFPIPACRGGTDDVSNLRALHWRANARHGAMLGALESSNALRGCLGDPGVPNAFLGLMTKRR
jgi:hypothetical protein